MATSADQSGNLEIDIKLANMLADPKAYASGEIFQTYEWLRANNPLGIAEPEGFDPFWVVTKHADLAEIAKDNKLFPYGDRSSTLIDKASDARQREVTGRPSMLQTLVQLDEPEHMQLRKLTQKWFMPGSIKKRSDDIEGIARKTLRKLEETQGQCDFAADIALHYPLEVVMQILGVPEKDYPLMLKLTQEIFAPLDEETQRAMDTLSPTAYAEMLMAIVAEYSTYFLALSEQRRKEPKDDLATLIAHAEVKGEPITTEQEIGYYFIIATAGHDTTSSSVTCGMWALATQPDLLAKLKADPSQIPGFIEETIRWATPVRNFMRSPSEDVTIAGRQIKKGDWMMLCYASANRDEDVFEAPNEFRIDREAQHIAFGYGAHMCLGLHLARMEMRILWEALIPRLKSVELDGEPAGIESTFVTGIKRLPIRFELED